MFDRFTDGAKRAMNEARRHAQRLNHEYLGTEHVLLGLLEEPGNHVCAMLESHQIKPDRLRSEVAKLVQPGSGLETTGQLPFTPGAKKSLEYSMEEALELRSTVLGTEHLLLGLARVPEGVASKALIASGFSLEKARALAKELGPEDGVRILEDAVEVLMFLQQAELAARVREVARKQGSRKWDR